MRTTRDFQVIGFDELRFAPTRADHISVRVDVVPKAVELLPHRYRIARAVDGHLRVLSISGVSSLDESRSPPASPRLVPVRIDAIPYAVILRPYRYRIARAVSSHLRSVNYSSCGGLDQHCGTPTNGGISCRNIAGCSACCQQACHDHGTQTGSQYCPHRNLPSNPPLDLPDNGVHHVLV